MTGLLQDGQTPFKLLPESTLIRVAGRTFHAWIGDGDMDGNERCGAVYDLIDSDLPIYGKWVEVDKGNRDCFGPPTCLRIGSRAHVQWVEAPEMAR